MCIANFEVLLKYNEFTGYRVLFDLSGSKNKIPSPGGIHTRQR
jgi:hypothetical protein